MINTLNIKQQQLQNGYFKIGTGPQSIFIMGSCRVINYVNYFAAMPQFTVYSIDPFNWNWDIKDNRVEYETIIKDLEIHTDLLQMIRDCKIFVHEHYQNAGMFNCDRGAFNNIYLFGMSAPVDICIPNWNDVFVLFQDIVNFDVDMRKKATQDYNVIGKLSEQTIQEIYLVASNGLSKFFKVCELSSFPEMADWFAKYADSVRLFWTYNHVTKEFTLAVFKLINNKYFDGKLTVDESHPDMFANNYTSLTEYDTAFKWNEERKKLVL